MAKFAKTISSPFGEFKLGENGLIYFYKTDDISIDKSIAEQFLETLSQLDSSGKTRIVVVQGKRVEYSFAAQQTLLTDKSLAKVAYVLESSVQYMTAELLKDIANTFKSHIKIGLFQSVKDAEEWLLEV